MNFKRTLLAGFWLASAAAMAQPSSEDPDWKESDVPPPPAFSLDKLIEFEVTQGSSLVYGVDPATLKIDGKDGIIRYVLVASSASGARNIMYEGIRCSTGEVRTYARYADGRWNNVANAEWRSLFGNVATRYAWRFARAGACDNGAVGSSVDQTVRRLKAQNIQFGNN